MTAPAALVPVEPLVPTVADLAEYEADVGDISVMDFAQVKQPASTGKKLRYIPDITEDYEEDVDEIVGVILHVQRYRQHYAKAWEPDSKEPPDCFAADYAEGIGDNGTGWGRHDCAECPLSAWGAKVLDDGRSEDIPPTCNERVSIVVKVNDDMLLPVQFDLPPSALKVVRRYLKQRRNQNLKAHQVITRFRLDTSGRFPRISMTQVGVIPEDQQGHVASYRAELEPVMAKSLRSQIAYRERLLEERGDTIGGQAS